MGQGVYRDFHSWLNPELALKINKKLDTDIGYQIRLNNNSTTFRVGLIYSDIGYKILKNTEVQLNLQYRMMVFRNVLSLGGFIIYKMNKEDFTVTYRLGWQQRQDFVSLFSEGTNDAYSRFRNRIQIKYKVNNKLELEAGSEIFHFTVPYIQLQRIRNSLGLDYSVNKASCFKLAYYHQPEFLGNRPEVNYIVVVGYTYSIKLYQSSKKKKKIDEG